MKKAVIVTDCKDNKLTALKGVCDQRFGMHNFEFHFIENKSKEDTPKSFYDLNQQTDERIVRLQTGFSPTIVPDDTGIYYATLQKGFLRVKNGWLLTALALFKVSPFYIASAMAESVPLDPGVWPYMSLPDGERCEKFIEVYELSKVKPLISCINETSEVDWYKQAFRNCVPFGK